MGIFSHQTAASGRHPGRQRAGNQGSPHQPVVGLLFLSEIHVGQTRFTSGRGCRSLGGKIRHIQHRIQHHAGGTHTPTARIPRCWRPMHRPSMGIFSHQTAASGRHRLGWLGGHRLCGYVWRRRRLWQTAPQSDAGQAGHGFRVLGFRRPACLVLDTHIEAGVADFLGPAGGLKRCGAGIDAVAAHGAGRRLPFPGQSLGHIGAGNARGTIGYHLDGNVRLGFQLRQVLLPEPLAHIAHLAGFGEFAAPPFPLLGPHLHPLALFFQGEIGGGDLVPSQLPLLFSQTQPCAGLLLGEHAGGYLVEEHVPAGLAELLPFHPLLLAPLSGKEQFVQRAVDLGLVDLLDPIGARLTLLGGQLTLLPHLLEDSRHGLLKFRQDVIFPELILR